MNILGLDVGSSSLKAGIVRDGKIVGKLVHARFPTRFRLDRAEVDPAGVLHAISSAIKELKNAAKTVDAIGLSVMSPAWVAMDKSGKALTPLITHQDRRSVENAREIERRVGKARHLAIAGNRPFPGGISSTTLSWYLQNQSGIIRRADLLGHLNTFLHRQFTGQRVIDPSNASFTGLYETVKQGGWSQTLCDTVGVSAAKLPEILESNVIGGRVTRAAATRFGLVEGTPVTAGIVDTSSAMLLIGARPGQLLNVSGSTDVLGLCSALPHPHLKLLTRALGVGKQWMSVATLAAAGSAIVWAHNQLFCDLADQAFYNLVGKLARASREKSKQNTDGVIFDPYLAGERASIEQKKAAFQGLTLGTTRQDMLAAMVEALASASGARIELLEQTGQDILSGVVISGGSAKNLREMLYRDWPSRWKFRSEDEASLRGLSRLSPRER